MERREVSPLAWDGLGKRIVSAIALIALGGFCIIEGGFWFDVLIIMAALIMIKEWASLTENHMIVLQWFGYLYVALPCACLLWLRGVSLPTEAGLGLTLCLMLVTIIAATDIGAYFIGKRFGSHKLSPTISPNKTWEGLGGGIGCAALISLLFVPYMHIFNSPGSVMCMSIFLSFISQVGDLFESWVKRQAEVKDSGNLIPGHGGLLDRFDGYMFTAPILALIVFFMLK